MRFGFFFLILSLLAGVPQVRAQHFVVTDCRDFATSDDLNLRLCDYVSVDKLKTDVLALLVTEQKLIESELFLVVDEASTQRLQTLKQFLFFIEQSALQKIEEICSLKGSTIPSASHLVSGCIYNQYNLIKNYLLKVTSHNKQILPRTPWLNAIEQTHFDEFINDVLLELAEKSKNDSDLSAQKKILMAEVLKIYESDGKSLYEAFQGICGLKMFSESPTDLLDIQIALTCEKDHLDDLTTILFKTLE